MDHEQQITGIIRRALASRGHRRIADLREALGLAVKMSGAEPHAEPVTNNLTLVEGLRTMMNDDGVRDNPEALSRVARWLRDLR